VASTGRQRRSVYECVLGQRNFEGDLRGTRAVPETRAHRGAHGGGHALLFRVPHGEAGCNLSEFKECMRDPVMASDGHSYERRNIEKWVREKGKKAKSPMTSAVLAPSVSSNKTLKFAINEAVDRQLLEMMERDPRVKSDIEVACRLLLQENAPDTPEQAGSNPAKRQRVTDSGSV
jgi:hypothetical protein